MKKLYSLFAVVVVAAAVNAQTVLLEDDFASASAGNNTTALGSPDMWAGDAYFPKVSNAFQAGGAVRLGTANSSGSVTTKAVNLSTDGGAFTVSFDVKGWESVEGDIVVRISGLSDQTITYSSTITQPFEHITLNYTGGLSNSTVTIVTTSKRAFIDNFKIVTNPGALDVTDVVNAKKSLVKNTSVDSELFFAAKSDVKIFNVNGQVVKSASVKENTSLNVSALPKGMYIVSGTLNGEAVSQKIIKK